MVARDCTSCLQHVTGRVFKNPRLQSMIPHIEGCWFACLDKSAHGARERGHLPPETASARLACPKFLEDFCDHTAFSPHACKSKSCCIVNGEPNSTYPLFRC